MEEAGADGAWEYIFEEYMEVRYDLYGPEGFDEDYKQDLIEMGEFEEALAAWEKPLPCKIKELEIQEQCLLWAMDQCRKASNFYRKKHSMRLI